MSQLVPQNFGAVSNRFANTKAADDLSAGIQSSFGILGYKGKVWSIRYRGEELQLMRDDGDGPRNSVEVVILKASSQVAKVFYEGGYVEGSTAPPDCFSNNGIRPEPSSKKKQCETCALCPMNQWGSRTTTTGKAGKACSDSKRLAIAPNNDLANEAFGGPMLLRVPAASLQDLGTFGQKMQQMGYPYYAIVTKIAFDPAESYPKFTFGALRPLTDDEADLVLAMRDQHSVERILSESEFDTAPAAQPQQTVNTAFEQTASGAPVNQQATQQTQAAPEQAAATGFGGASQAQQTEQKAPEQPVQQTAKATVDHLVQQAQPEQPVQQKAPEPEAPKADPEAEMRARIEQEVRARMAAEMAAQQQAAPVTPQGNTGGGFGNATPAQAEAQPQQAAPQTVQQEPAPTPQTQQSAPIESATSAFESELDDMLAGLLPTT